MSLIKTSALFCMVGGLASSSFALSIVSFNGTRGGNSSLSNAAPYASTRTALQANFAGTTFTGVSTLTAANLTGADVVWIGSSFTGVQAINALTGAEQTALYNFVLGGGRAMLFAENDSFAGNAAVVNASILSPFGVTVTGTGAASSQHLFTNPGASPANGHFGTVSSPITSQFPGWFNTIPGTASTIATLSTNGQASILRFDWGALGAGSGKVWLFSDSGYQTTGGTVGAEWNTLYSNMLYEPVPEPATMVALSLGLVGTLRRRRK